jgi:cysteine desulfurase family protein
MNKNIYLDNAATSHPKPEEVYLAVASYLRAGGSAGRGSYIKSMDAGRLLFETRELLAELFTVEDSENFVFTANATQAINQALFGLLRPGDRVVTTDVEHNAVVRPLRALQDRGVTVVKVAADAQTGQVDRVALQNACFERPTKLLMMTCCSNVSGALQPVAALGRWCRERGIVFMLDGSQVAGSLPLDLTELQADLFAAPGHKGLLGPQGTGILYCAPGLELLPLIYGGTGARSESDRQPLLLPEQLESGTYNLPGLAGLHAALGFILETGVAAIRKRELEHIEQLYSGLASISGVEVYGPDTAAARGAVISFNLTGRDPSEVGYLLSQQDVAVRTGLHCAPDAHRSLGTFPLGTLRAAPGYFSTAAEIDVFLLILRGIVQGRS